ncbi:heavy metal-responsive transcriptional regulator [Synechococcus sp. PCC 7336]|uniref:heavy metal-responsive transcriptional regulator n=1 Tax=Synechococcus sp. PCC 7336 TaxID=195250 RepID=UPI0003487457|nr:heavy metal-responsive transcriptional regulator [Synechococcus sp. PCC 7336]
MSCQITELLKIGELKEEIGISVKTIRYYEELGLIEAEKRTEGGFRLFSRAMLPRLRFIIRAKELGFSLREIGSILQIHDRGDIPCGEVKKNIQARVLEIEDNIRKLEELKTQLRDLISDASPASVRQEGIICPIIQHDNDGA